MFTKCISMFYKCMLIVLLLINFANIKCEIFDIEIRGPANNNMIMPNPFQGINVMGEIAKEMFSI